MPEANVAIAIPAFNPGPALPEIVARLREAGVARVVVVDDGSGRASRVVFDAIERAGTGSVLRHAVNLGKGAALKTALNELLVHPGAEVGFVTMDADGQHGVADVLAVTRRLAERPEALVLGVRRFEGRVPLRSRLGNSLTRLLVRLVLGLPISDTQTGLRGIPRSLAPVLLRLDAQRYEFEMDMLVLCKHMKIPIAEYEIATIYHGGNESSHFNPVRDSLRIYLVLLRFLLTSLLSAGLDNLLFSLALGRGATLRGAQATARAATLVVNYGLLRRFVFLSDQRHLEVLPKYLAVVAAFAALSYASIDTLAGAGWPALRAKLVTESLMFFASFAVMRELVFSRGRP